MEFQFDLNEPLQCLEQIYLQLSPMVVAFRPIASGGLFGPAFGSGLMLAYRGEAFIITTESVLTEICVAYRQQAWACSAGQSWPLRDLGYASSQLMDIGAIHLPADWLGRQPMPLCFDLGPAGWPDPLASAFTLLLGHPVPSRQPAAEPDAAIGVVARAYRNGRCDCDTMHPLFVEFDSRDILSSHPLDKAILQHNYQLCGTPAIGLYHSLRQDSNRLTATLQGFVTEWDRAGIGAVAASALLLHDFLDNFLRQMRQGASHVQGDMADLLARFRR
ncbi:hypothetical protein [Chromobacterium alticapitis]|uniref:Uncharacterized protein n=1 Tax=Chromobacterium alticapitis TaxID=2073169 RepID=A0A2S5DK44_9NEIS|nr:hypothetical protein [Chromobacterium alticapitis]POZ63417.1 hypothetical protein C2I19_03455 [Chromobacterium alticapitis]